MRNSKKTQKLSLFLFVAMALTLVSITPIATAVTTVYETGYGWDTASLTGTVDWYGEWQIDYTGTETQSTTTQYNVGEITDFSGFTANWGIHTFGSHLPSWWWSTYAELDYCFGFTGADGTTIYTNGQIHRSTDAVFGGHVASIGYGIQNEWFNGGYLGGTGTGLNGASEDNPINGTMIIWKNGDNLTFTVPYQNFDWDQYFSTSNGWSFQTSISAMKGVIQATWDSRYINYSIPLTSTWFDTVDVNMWISWKGNAFIDAHVFLAPYTGGNIPNFTPIPADGSPIYNPDPQQSWISQAWAMITGLWTLANTFIKLAFDFAPLLVPIVLIYVSDVIATSIKTLSFRPMGYLFENIVNFLKLALDTAIGIANAIANLLPF